MARSLRAILLLYLPIVAPPLSAWQVQDVVRVPDGYAVSASDGDFIWCGPTFSEDSLVVRLDPETGEIAGRIDAPEAACRGFAVNDQGFWYLGPGRFYRLSFEGRVLDRRDNPYPAMKGLAITDAGFWTVERRNGVSALALFRADGAEIRRFEINLSNPGDIAYDGTNLWITDPTGGSVYKYDIVQNRLLDIFPSPASNPTAVTYHDRHLYLIDDGDGADDDVLYRISLDAEPAPRLLPSSFRVDFGLAQFNVASNVAISLFNIGNADLTINNVGLARRNGYQISNFPQQPVVQPGRQIVLNLLFTPEDYQRYDDTLVLQTNDPITPITRIVLTGHGVYSARRLGVRPEEYDFGMVRADRRRDGSRRATMLLVNEGNDLLIVDTMYLGIPEIFRLDRPALPFVFEPAETLRFAVEFTPFRDIEYLDTIVVHANDEWRYNYIYLAGSGSDSVYAEGTVLWEHQMTGGVEGLGAMAVQSDMNRDGIQEVIVAEPDGRVFCLNGFASGDADYFWEANLGLQGAGITVSPSGSIAAGVQLNGDRDRDLLLAVRGAAGGLFAIDGRRGAVLWDWSPEQYGAGNFLAVQAPSDYSGDGNNDPVILCEARDGNGLLARLDGATGRQVWMRNLVDPVQFELAGDLNGDGAEDFLVATGQGLLATFDGQGGGLIRSAETLPTSGLMAFRNDLDGRPLAVVSYTAGGVEMWDLRTMQTIWSLDMAPRGENYGPLEHALLVRESPEAEITGVALAGQGGSVLVVDPGSGRAAWTLQYRSPVRAIALLPRRIDRAEATLAIGLDDGRVIDLRVSDHGEEWIYEGRQPVVAMQSFADVDLGGSDDLLVQFGGARWTVTCISTGGDLRASAPPAPAPVPQLLSLGLSPNPFNASVVIDYALPPGDQSGSLRIYSIGGREVFAREVNSREGRLTVDFGAASAGAPAAGYYLFRLISRSGQSVVRGQYIK
ncbi:MAG: hypothetical protein FJY67_05640 [Calditrichaeota bacterium]|nr:hypothetical protein [Calditrichota bacterium]